MAGRDVVYVQPPGAGLAKLLWFLGGIGVGVGGFWAYQKFGGLFKLGAGPGPDLPALNVPGALGVWVRQLRRYAFASSQDKSPVVGLTHASYALILLDTLEEVVGREAIMKMGYNPATVRAFITANQDKHAEQLKPCDRYLQEVLAMERADPNGQLPGHVMAGWGAAPRGA